MEKKIVRAMIENLINTLYAIYGMVSNNEEPCDVCRHSNCLCDFVPAFGGKELEDWPMDKCQRYVMSMRKRVFSLTEVHVLRKAGNEVWFLPAVNVLVNEVHRVIDLETIEDLRISYKEYTKKGWVK